MVIRCNRVRFICTVWRLSVLVGGLASECGGPHNLSPLTHKASPLGHICTANPTVVRLGHVAVCFIPTARIRCYRYYTVSCHPSFAWWKYSVPSVPAAVDKYTRDLILSLHSSGVWQQWAGRGWWLAGLVVARLDLQPPTPAECFACWWYIFSFVFPVF